MKRSTKNIICILILILMIGCTYITMNYAKNNIKSNDLENMNGNPPSMPNGGSEPPEKPSDDNQSSEMPEKPNDDNQSGEMPEKPNEDNEGTSIPEKPSDNKQSNENVMIPSTNTSASITLSYYIVFGILSLVISCVSIYLVMSKFNSKTKRETFYSKDRVIIYILSVVIVSSILTYFDSFITNKYFITSTNSSFKPNDNMNSNISYSSVTEIKEDTQIDSGNYVSSDSDENAILVTSATATLNNIVVDKTGSSDGGDATSFYGTNSAILAKDKAILNIENATITTNATGANGVFSYGGSATTNNSTSDGTTINISNSKITTTKDNSGGIMTTGGGITNAYNLDIITSGTSSAAIRSDRGGGTVYVNKGTYKTTGKGSPAIYSTADITVKNASLISTASEGIVIEGMNKVTIENVSLTDTNNTLNGQSTTYKNIFLYQSMSGDAADGRSIFTAKDSNIITNKGDTFYITNTTATINLENNKIINNDKSGNFLRAKSDSWGNSNSNGGNVTVNLTNQKITGNIVIDKISTLSMNMNSSYYEGTINTSNEAKKINLVLDSNSKIKLTGDSYVTSLENADKTNSNIDFNGYKLYVNGILLNS